MRPTLTACAAAIAFAGGAIAETTLLINARVLDASGERLLDDTTVVVEDGRISFVGASSMVNTNPDVHEIVDLDGLTLIPGLIDLHTHLLLHPYDEASWNDLVLRESLGLRTARAVAAAEATLMAGFTTIRELGTEGAGYADVGVRDAIAQSVVPGPRVLAATRAIVATGAYGPSGFDPRWQMPVGAQVADGEDGVRRVVREQIAAGADWIKVYADYRRRPGDPATPTFSQTELNAIVDEATSAGLPVAAHATTAEAMRRAVMAGVKTIEHGYDATPEVLALMAERGVALCPTLGASEAMGIYTDDPSRMEKASTLMERALDAGVTIACGSDAGVFDHGDNAREIELLVELGMTPTEALACATSVAAQVIGRENDLGRIAEGFVADMIAIEGDPLEDPTALRRVRFVMQGGAVVRARHDD